MPLNESQNFTGTAGVNRAAFVTVNVDEKADCVVVRDELPISSRKGGGTIAYELVAETPDCPFIETVATSR